MKQHVVQQYKRRKETSRAKNSANRDSARRERNNYSVQSTTGRGKSITEGGLFVRPTHLPMSSLFAHIVLSIQIAHKNCKLFSFFF